MADCFNKLWGEERIILANQNTPEFWKSAAGLDNLELICLRELLEFKQDWHYAIFRGRHSLPLLSRRNVERKIVERIQGVSYNSDQLRKSHFIGAAFKPPNHRGSNSYE